MALLTSVYTKIDMLVADKTSGVRILTTSWPTQASRLAGEPYTSVLQYDLPLVDLVGTNYLAMAYAQLKAHPDFADAVDA